MQQIMDMLEKCPEGLTSAQLTQRINTVSKKSIDRALGKLKLVSSIVPLCKVDRAQVWGIAPPSERDKMQRAFLSESFALVAAEDLAGWLPSSAAREIKKLATAARALLAAVAGPGLDDGERRILADWPQRFKSFPGAFTLQTPVAKHASLVDDIKDAVYHQRQIDAIYINRAGQRSEMPNFHPLAYLQVGHTGYVVGYASGKDAAPLKQYAVQRFVQAHVRDSRSPAVAPPGFKLDEFLMTSDSASFIGGPRNQVRLRVWGWLIPILQESWLANDMRMDPPDAEIDTAGGAIVTATLTMSWQFEHWLLSCGENVEVLEPAELRQKIVSRLRSGAARYATADMSSDA